MDAVVKFLNSRVAGKTLCTDELVYFLEDGTLEGVYSDQMYFSNVKSSDNAVCFDLFVVSYEKIYELDELKQHSSLRKEYSGVALFRYELVKRKSTGELTGFMRFISASRKDVPAEAVASSVYNVVLTENELSWQEQQVLYRDQPGKDGTYRPVCFEARNRFYFENGKLRYEYKGICYDVIPSSFEKLRSKDVFPSFISKEKEELKGENA